MLLQSQIAHDFGQKQTDHVGRCRDPVAWPQGLRRRTSTEHMSAFQNTHRFSSPRKVGGRHEAIVASSNHDAVVPRFRITVRHTISFPVNG